MLMSGFFCDNLDYIIFSWSTFKNKWPGSPDLYLNISHSPKACSKSTTKKIIIIAMVFVKFFNSFFAQQMIVMVKCKKKINN